MLSKVSQFCNQFTGFSIIQLRDKSGNLSRDTYAIIEKLLSNLPEGSWNVELHLAAAALARAVHSDQWHYHVMRADALTSGKPLQTVKNISEHIRLISSP